MLAAALALLVAGLSTAGCGSDGSDGAQGPPGPAPPTDPNVAPSQDAPGVVLTVDELGGASGSGGSYRVGDHVSITFELKKSDGTPWDIAEMSSGRALVSGPTFNYQRVIAEQSDVITAAVKLADGKYKYTFADAIPDKYLPPLNDSDSFGPDDGELADQALLAGTYTVGLYCYWTYEVNGTEYRDVANITKDFLFGGASSLESREVVTRANCNQCHSKLQAHGGMRQDVTLCLLCHTSGAEDRNNPDVADGTPGVSIDFRVMIHKIHAGHSLPSVQGVATNSNGSRKYDATPKPYEIVGFQDRINDFSEIAFPVWPNLNIPMPRDVGYSGLTTDQQLQEDTIREGPATCDKCHGDPDGDGPLVAPKQGQVAFSQPSRRACGSCHDDIDWTSKYSSNGQTMPANRGNDTCILCHPSSNDPLSPKDAHVHPLLNPSFNPGVNIKLRALTEAGTNDGDGTIDPGERISVEFNIKDDSGALVPASSLTSAVSVVINGPRQNRSLLLSTSIPLAALPGNPPYTTNVPQPVSFEFVGDATGSLGDVFTTSRTPHWNQKGAATTVFVRTATGGGASTLTTASVALQNFADVAGTTNFARNDYVVLEDGTGQEEYTRIALVDGNRLWFTTPLRFAHAASAAVAEVTLTTKVENTDYTLNGTTGTITELVEFGSGNAVVVTYTSDFIMPSVYQPALNDSPDLTEVEGDWVGKDVVDGTYTLGLWTSRNSDYNPYGEITTYRITSPPATIDFLVGSATEVDPYTLISSPQNCYACHNDVFFHGGGRRGLDTCLLCHTISGDEDRPRYTAGNAPATTGVTIDFRTMLHKIHMGANLAKAEDYIVVGFGSAAYPNNYSANGYADVEFPPMPDGTKQCGLCHGADNTAWHQPSDRNHPTEQSQPALVWRAVCNSCHDSDAATGHIQAQTSPSGVESCEVCHGADGQWPVEVMHKSR